MRKYAALLAFISILALSILTLKTRADETSALSNALAEEIDSANEAVRGIDVSGPGPETEDQFYFRRFWLRLQARAGFEIPGLTNLSVVPEVELLWERSMPDGWTSYEPDAESRRVSH